MSLKGVKTGVHNNNHITLTSKSFLENPQQSHSLMMLNTELAKRVVTMAKELKGRDLAWAKEGGDWQRGATLKVRVTEDDNKNLAAHLTNEIKQHPFFKIKK